MKIAWNVHFRVRNKFSVIIEKLMHKLIFNHKNVKIGNAKIFNTRVFFSDIDRFFLRNVRKFLSYFGQHDRKIFKRYQEIANKFCKPFCLNLVKKVLQKSTK